MRHSSHSSSATSNSTASPKNRLSFFSKKRQQSRDETGSSDKIFEVKRDISGKRFLLIKWQPQYPEKILSSPFTLPNIEPLQSNGNLLSPDSFVAATHDMEFLHLRENIRRLRKAPSGPDPKKVDQAWEVYKKLREESLQLCRSLLEKSRMQYRYTDFCGTYH